MFMIILYISFSSLTSKLVCILQIEKFGLNSVDVKEIVLEMREYRMGLIQTPDQLRFSYQAIIEGAKHILNQNSENEEVCVNKIIHKLHAITHLLSLPVTKMYPIL